MNACPGGKEIQDRKRGEEQVKNSGESKSKGGGWLGSRDTEGDRERSIKQLKWWGGDK